MSRGNGIDLTGNSAGADFKPRLGRIGRDNPRSFINKINKAVARSRAAMGRTKYSGTSGRFNARGRGAKVVGGLKHGGGWKTESGMRFRARRVIVKARVVKLKGAASRAAYAHLRYLQREGASLDRERGDEFETGKASENVRELGSELGSEIDRDADQNLSREPDPEQSRSDLYASFTDDGLNRRGDRQISILPLRKVRLRGR